MSKELKIRIGDVSISLEGDVLKAGCESVSPYGPFSWDGKPDIRVFLHRGRFDKGGGEKVFECPPIWSLYRQNGNSILEIFHDLPGLQRTLVLSHDPGEAHLYFNGISAHSLDPFYGPTMELLMVNHLARGGGAIVHGCGVARDGKGLLFVGESGAGKSTLAGLWNQEEGIEVLSDDRTIIRKRGHQFWIYGTPWHGEGRFASPLAAALEKVFFVRHGAENSLKEIREIESVSRLLTCSFPPHWDAEGMGFTLELFSDLAGQVPCQELAFRHDGSVIEAVIGGLGD